MKKGQKTKTKKKRKRFKDCLEGFAIKGEVCLILPPLALSTCIILQFNLENNKYFTMNLFYI